MMCKTLLCLLPLLSIMSAQDSGDLYFMLNGEIYPSGSSVVITEIGEHDPNTGAYNPDSSLACVTSEVNSQCCRERDGGNLGEWQFPDSSMVPRRSGSPGTGFTRSGFNRQVRLNRQNDALSPAGTYTCMVPRDNGEMASANITLSKLLNCSQTSFFFTKDRMCSAPHPLISDGSLCDCGVGSSRGSQVRHLHWLWREILQRGRWVCRQEARQPVLPGCLRGWNWVFGTIRDHICAGTATTIPSYCPPFYQIPLFLQVRAVSGENSEGPYSEPIPLCPGVWSLRDACRHCILKLRVVKLLTRTLLAKNPVSFDKI